MVKKKEAPKKKKGRKKVMPDAKRDGVMVAGKGKMKGKKGSC